MKMLMVALIICLASASHAADPWDKADIALGATAATLKIVDWGQTRYIATHPRTATQNGYYETNPLMSRNPSTREVDIYFAGSALVQAAVAHYLPSKWRKVWLMGWVGISGYNAQSNYSAGIGFEFP